ncbi:hypothetical protein E2C01_099061 [Portunus trituberculatus]|uniref:Uncharacterized protein n=1 Tax=Portunus trituberculatus TaxID=210409 RepID=A0A5B7K9U8_PORTR|nr:hypothetical protein [Portunus trituberculatus]
MDRRVRAADSPKKSTAKGRAKRTCSSHPTITILLPAQLSPSFHYCLPASPSNPAHNSLKNAAVSTSAS